MDALTQPPTKPFLSGWRLYTVVVTFIFVPWVTRKLAPYLGADVAKMVAEALTADMQVQLALAGGALAMWFKARANKTALPSVFAKLLGGAALLALVGCATWPKQCEQTLTGIGCRCTAARVVTLPDPSGKPRPAGRVVVECDGQVLPLTIDGDEVR